MVDLPSLSLYSMTKPQLKEFIPTLIDASTNPLQSLSDDFMKPDWWPVTVPWTSAAQDREKLHQQLKSGDFDCMEKLRSLVQACYEFNGLTDLLNLSNMDANMAGLTANDAVSIDSSSDESDSEIVDVFVCFYCDQCFGGKYGQSRLEEHVRSHVQPGVQQSFSRSVVMESPVVKPNQEQQTVYKQEQQKVYKQVQQKVYKQEKQTVYKQAQQFVRRQEKQTVYKQEQQLVRRQEKQTVYKQEQPIVSSLPEQPSKITNSLVSNVVKPVSPPVRPPFLPRPLRRHRDIPIHKRTDLPCDNGVMQSDFFKLFGLISDRQAQSDAAKPKLDVDIDCEIVAVEGLDGRPMASPRTPRSLMSQLSRDCDGSSRKRLSFSVADDGSDCDIASPPSSMQGALLNVPFSSFLGRRLKKHIRPDNSMCTVKDPEQYCHTDKKKNDFVNKLRYRPSDYPVTYRRRRKMLGQYVHDYKFNKEDISDFTTRLNTGLNKESRRLKRLFSTCVVNLKQVSEAEIEFWKDRNVKHGAEWIDDDISIVEIEPPVQPPVSIPVTGYSKTVPKKIDTNLPGQYQPIQPGQYQPIQPGLLEKYPHLQAQMFNTVQPRVKPSAKPRPQFLVKKVEKQFDGNMSSKLVYVPISDVPTEPQKRIGIRPRNSFQPGIVRRNPQTGVLMHENNLNDNISDGSNRRKQHFAKIRCETDDDDDDISLHSQSSDDDVTAPVSSNMSHFRITNGRVTCMQERTKLPVVEPPVRVTNNVQRHFTSHPVRKSFMPNIMAKSKSCSSVGPARMPSSVGVSGLKRQFLDTPQLPVVPPKQPLLVVDDVIYIDDD